MSDCLWIPQSTLDKIPLLVPDEVKYIIVHCTDTSCNNTLTVQDIDGWHRARGFQCVGYHYVIKSNGDIMFGRPLEYQGAHAVLYNNKSIGVAYVGGRLSSGAPGDTRTYAQKISMAWIFGQILKKYPHIDEIIGHNDVASKTCPCFNARAEYSNFISKFKDGQNF